MTTTETTTANVVFVNLTPHPVCLFSPEAGAAINAAAGAIGAARKAKDPAAEAAAVVAFNAAVAANLPLIVVPPTTPPARCDQKTETRPALLGVLAGGVVVSESTFGAVQDLPAPAAGVVYIVSGLVLSRPEVQGRADVFAPGLAVRDGEGRVIGAIGLSATPAYPAPVAPEPAPAPKPSEADILEACRAYRRRTAFNNRATPEEVAKAEVLLVAHFDRTSTAVDYFGQSVLGALAHEYILGAEKAARDSASATTRAIVRKFTSQNGRWGLEIKAHPRLIPADGRIEYAASQSWGAFGTPGTARLAGEMSGVKVVVVDANPDAKTWVVVTRELAQNPRGGARILCSMGLQGNGRVAVIESPEGGSWDEVGYKGRKTYHMGVRNGDVVSLPASEVLELK
jgi:hypothetical protein